MHYISDKEFALLKRTGVAMDDPNLGKTGRMLGDRFEAHNSNSQHVLHVHFILGSALNISHRDLVILTITQ